MILLAYAITFGNNTALANTNVKYDNIDNQLKRNWMNYISREWQLPL